MNLSLFLKPLLNLISRNFLGVRKNSQKSNLLFNNNNCLIDSYLNNNGLRKNNIIRWLHGKDPNRFYYISFLYKNDKLIIFNNIKCSIIYIEYKPFNMPKDLFIKTQVLNLMSEGISNYKDYLKYELRNSLYDINSHNSYKKDILDKSLAIYLPYFKDNDFIVDKFKAIQLETVFFKDKNFDCIPPVLLYILKNWESQNLEKKITRKCLSKLKRNKNFWLEKDWLY